VRLSDHEALRGSDVDGRIERPLLKAGGRAARESLSNGVTGISNATVLFGALTSRACWTGDIRRWREAGREASTSGKRIRQRREHRNGPVKALRNPAEASGEAELLASTNDPRERCGCAGAVFPSAAGGPEL